MEADEQLEVAPDDVIQISYDESDDEEDAIKVYGGEEDQGVGLADTALVIIGTRTPGMRGRVPNGQGKDEGRDGSFAYILSVI